MPSHKIHIAVANKVNEELKLNKDLIMLGSVLPDLTNEHDHGLSHFQHSYKELASSEEFRKKYPSYVDPISIGYIIHLLTDKYYNFMFYNRTEIDGIELNRDVKHSLFDTYDEYLLKHKLVDKFDNSECINKIPDYQDITFDKDYLNKYINKHNKMVDDTLYDKDYNIEHLDYLNDLFNGCIKYILEELTNY